MKSNHLIDRINTLLSMIYQNITEESIALDGFWYQESDYKPGNFVEVIDERFRKFSSANERWAGKADSHAWFLKEIDVPIAPQGRRYEFAMYFDNASRIDAQYLAYVDDSIIKCLDNEHTSFTIPHGEHRVAVYAYSGMKNTNTIPFKPSLQLINEGMKKLYYHISVPFQVLKQTDKQHSDYYKILDIVNQALNMLDFSDEKPILSEEQVERAITFLDEKLYDKELVAIDEDTPVVSCVGHTHIDIAWLWSMAQTREKAQRSFSNVLYNMDKYEEFTFMLSQPILYRFVKEDCPALYELVKERVAEGRWEVEGSMYVESDCTLPSGESFIRQIMMGKKFFREEFGKENTVVWLPDAFGYSAALPQIFVKSGITTFVTSKLSWNDTNTPPFDTFRWEGIDGSKILSYFLTGQSYTRGQAEPSRLTTYVGCGNPDFIKGTYERYRQKDINANVLNVYGFGDGGGGPSEWDIENITRMQNGMTDFPVARHDSAVEFFKRLHEKVDGNEKLPTWSDELYFELHRGVYTSIAEVKKNNRRSEYALQNLEFSCALDEMLCGGTYPSEKIEELWEILLKNQFHDILPGSSVKEVYQTTAKEHKQLLLECADLTDAAVVRLAEKTGAKEGYFLLNSNSIEGDYCMEVDGECRTFKIPSKGYCVAMPEPLKGTVIVGKQSLENEFFLIDFDENYNIVGIYDKKNDRQVLKEGCKGNILRLYDDYPYNYDAWEISDYYLEKYVDLTDTVSCAPVIDGCRSGFRIEKRYNKSVFVQTIFLYEDCDRIDFKTEIDWHEKHKLLKALFPLDINAKKATYDIQFGTTERPTTSSTSWEQAKFEVFAHKYADISEGNYGVALLNDCKYGYSAMENVLGLSLLRAPTWPNEDADMGKHEFTYSLYPHSGNHAQSDVYRHAIMLNNPPLVKKLGEGAGVPVSYSWLTCDKENIIVESVKKSEDGSGWIVRCFERGNARTKANISLAMPTKEVLECDMMENVESPIVCNQNQIALTFRPFEIKTLKIMLA